MTIVSDDTSLAGAVAVWRPMLDHPEETWFFCENGEAVKRAVKELGMPVRADRVTTLAKFAVNLVSAECPGIRLIRDEEKIVIFHDIVRRSPLGKDKRNLSLSFIYELIGRYNYLAAQGISLKDHASDPQTGKHRILYDIFTQYRDFCGTDKLDDVGIISKAIELLQTKNPVRNAVFYQIEPANYQLAQLMEAVRGGRDFPEYPVPEPSVPKAEEIRELKTPIRKYRTAKEEVEATLDQAAALLESGVEPNDVVILTPDIEGTSRLVGNTIEDFYYGKDGVLHPLRCTSIGVMLASFPLIQAVMSALSCVIGDFPLEDLQTVFSADSLRNLPKKDAGGAIVYEQKDRYFFTVDKLNEFSLLNNVTEKKDAWLRAVEHSKKAHEKTEEYTYRDHFAEIIRGFDLIAGPAGRQETFAKRCEALKDWLYRTRWAVCPVSGPEDRARETFLSYLDILAGDLTCPVKCDLQTFVMNLREFITTHDVRESVRVKDCIRLQKLRMASGLRAKHVFIIALTAENLPKYMSALPPFTAKETEELCVHPDGTKFSLSGLQFEMEFRNFAAALRTAEEELHLSCHLANGSNHTAPSSFLTRVGEPEKEPAVPSITHSVWYGQIHAGNAVNDAGVSAEGLLHLPDAESLKGRIDRERNGYPASFGDLPVFADRYRTHGFTATEIETYLACPYQWYLAHHLHLENPDDENAEHLKVGNAVHHALERFIKEYQGAFDDEVAMYGELMKLVSEEFDRQHVYDSPSWEATKRWYFGEVDGAPSSTFREFVKDEIRRRKEGWTKNEAEKKFVDQTIAYGDDTITVTGKIDRVLLTDDGGFTILDYKTGTSFAGTEKKRHAVQIPLYMEAYKALRPDAAPREVGSYLEVTPDTYKTVGIKLKGDKSPEDACKRAMTNVFAAKKGMMEGICSRPDECKDSYCPYRRICRVVMTGWGA